MVLRNYIELEEGRPARLHFTDGQVVEKTITDPALGREKVVRTLVLTADELNGGPTSGLLSVTSEKLAVLLWPYVERGTLANYTFVILAEGRGFQRSYSVEPLPR